MFKIKHKSLVVFHVSCFIVPLQQINYESDIAQGGENMSEQNEFGRVSVEELEKAFETEEQEEEKE